MHKAKLFKSEDELKAALKEATELVAIFTKSAKTAERKEQ
jgi:hypothetical protein